MNFSKKDIYHLLGLIVAIILLHARAYDAGFVTDFTGLWEKMQGKGLSDALRSFGFPSLMPLLNVFYLLLYQCFGLSPVPWFLFFVLFYAMGLFFFYKISEMVLADFGIVNGKVITWLSLLLILVSPYQVEALIWKVGLGHISAVMFFMMSLYYALYYLSKEKKKDWAMMGLCLVGSLLCFEWGLVFPFVLAFFVWGYKQWRPGVRLLLTTGVIVIAYLAVTKMIIGKAVGHYDVSIDSFSRLTDMWATILKYLVKHLSFLQFGSYKMKMIGYKVVGQPLVLLGALVLFCGVIFLLNRSGKAKHRLIVVLSLCCIVSLVLVSPLYFQNTHVSENDRYASLMLPFFTLLFVICLYSLPRIITYISIGIFLIASIFYQQKLVSYWQNSNDILESLIETFPEDVSPSTLMLNLPENYRGVFMIRDFSGDNPFRDLLVMRGKQLPQLDLVAQYVLPEVEQEISIARIDSNSIKLSLSNWGSYWMKDGKGTDSYETDRYSVKFKDRSYELKMIGEKPYGRLLYTDGRAWEYLDF